MNSSRALNDNIGTQFQRNQRSQAASPEQQRSQAAVQQNGTAFLPTCDFICMTYNWMTIISGRNPGTRSKASKVWGLKQMPKSNKKKEVRQL
jgi:hypothetical protein